MCVDAKQMLYVMPELVRQDVRLGKVAGRAKAALKLVIKTEIDVNLLIEWTVERAHRSRGRAATGLGHVAEEHELRVLIRHTALGEDRPPRVLHIVEHEGDELHETIFGGRARDLAIHSRRAGAVGGRCAAGHKIPTEDETQYEQYDGATDSHSGATAGKEATTLTAPIFDVGAFFAWGPSHRLLSATRYEHANKQETRRERCALSVERAEERGCGGCILAAHARREIVEQRYTSE